MRGAPTLTPPMIERDVVDNRPDHPRVRTATRSDDPRRRLIRALKGRLGHYTRPEGRGEPFRARVFAEPALQRTVSTSTPRFPSLIEV